jgi:hypothetical protein
MFKSHVHSYAMLERIAPPPLHDVLAYLQPIVTTISNVLRCCASQFSHNVRAVVL